MAVSAYVLFALAFGIQVKCLFDGEECNVFQYGWHAYWSPELTDAHIPRTGRYSAIATSIVELPTGKGETDVGLIRKERGAKFKVNHWIAVVPISAEDFKHEPLEVRGQPGQNLSAVYKNMYLLETDRRGDCGVDVLTMILGWDRTKESRNLVRD